MRKAAFFILFLLLVSVLVSSCAKQDDGDADATPTPDDPIESADDANEAITDLSDDIDDLTGALDEIDSDLG